MNRCSKDVQGHATSCELQSDCPHNPEPAVKSFALNHKDLINVPVQSRVRFGEVDNLGFDGFGQSLCAIIATGLANGQVGDEGPLVGIALRELGLQRCLELAKSIQGTRRFQPDRLAPPTVRKDAWWIRGER